MGDSSTDSFPSSTVDVSTQELDSFLDLDSTIQSILRNADSYLNSTIFSSFNNSADVSMMSNSILTDTSFEDQLQNLDNRIAQAATAVNAMAPPPAPPPPAQHTAQAPATAESNRRSQRRRAASEETVAQRTSQTTGNASDDDIVFVSSTILRRPFIETVDLCSPLPYRNRRLEDLIIDENVITLDDTPIPEVQGVAGAVQPNNVQPNNAQPSNVPPTGPTAAKRSKPAALDDSHVVGLTCPVCLDGLKGRQPQSTTCGHLYCKACIMEVLRTTHKCAICKRVLRKSNIHPIYL